MRPRLAWSLAVALFASALLVGLHGVGRARDQETADARTLADMEALQALDRALSEQVLALRQGLVWNYDRLNGTVRQLDERMRRLPGELEPIDATGMDRLASAWDDRGAMVERFKSQHSFFRNSMRYLPIAAEQAAAAPRADAAQIRYVLVQVLLRTQHAEEDARSIEADLKQLLDRPHGPELEVFAEHARVVAEVGADLAGLTRSLIAHRHVGLLAELAQRVGDRVDARLEASAEQGQQLLRLSGLLLALLLTSICGLFWSLRSVRVLDASLTASRGELESEQLERARVQEALVDARVGASSASVAKNDFLANMSHEIRTPLTAIVGYVDLMLDDWPDAGGDATLGERLDIVKRNAAQLFGLVRDLLDISHLEAGGLDVDRVPYRPVEVARDALRAVGPQASAKGLALDLRVSERVPAAALGDPLRVRQILDHLLSNAIKFTERGEVAVAVDVQTSAAQPWLEISVQDSGPGLGEQELSEIFVPFSQLDGSRTRPAGGVGVGLSLSARIARLLGGEIRVQSRRGEGSCFALRVPGAAAPWSGAPTGSGVAEASSGHAAETLSCRVLLVEDCVDNRRLMGAFLRRAGAEVEFAVDGQAAVETMHRVLPTDLCFDIVLMDIQMPVMDGYAATRAIRELGYARPIVAVTAHALERDRARCLAAGCNDYMTKPVKRDALIRMVSRYVGSPEDKDR